MKKILALGMALAVLPVAAQAAEVIGVYNNQGQCNTAWNAANNAERKALRQSGSGLSQNELGGQGNYYCAKQGNVWVLLKL